MITSRPISNEKKGQIPFRIGNAILQTLGREVDGGINTIGLFEIRYPDPAVGVAEAVEAARVSFWVRLPYLEKMNYKMYCKNRPAREKRIS